MSKNISTEKLLSLIIKWAEDKKAINPITLDLSFLDRMTDYMIVVSGDADPHVKAIAREIESQLKKTGIKDFLWEGSTKSGWIIFDLGEVIVHIMLEKERSYYNLEELWGKKAIIYH